ncbi:hypothetical protein BAUCODRAFT_272483 [Baudoinia panamericana UAMH 10762]|uniref:Major facilitator superfamily (MFS) profile domain-containing protein n=1 Tax=Baudoinia panamericana (strain UAMH 10762) TaxID=717646 RepID=M2N247_BAUPA|nr:uncharacterized protein BAUCODRAFT_272483 [Baudoinia panamericana UAMH 10762]EMC93054.1 hypothetical protein BAUCODRAFT_272483 [Baudoinia panamericana UAMH 10762]
MTTDSLATSSFGEDPEKDVGLNSSPKDGEVHLTKYEADLRDAAEPPFTEEVEPAANGSALERVASAKPSVNNIKSVPNGGLVAWLQVLGSFFIYWNSWGIVNTFGVYQTYYETGLLASSSPSDIAWVGSIQAFLLMIGGAIAGPVYDAGYIRSLLLGGSILTVFGQMMLSLSTKLWQVMLSQGICMGIGLGILFTPGVAILSTYWSTRIALATGIAAAGSSLGGTVMPIVFYRLQPVIGFAWATRVLGFIMLFTLIISNLTLKVRVLPAGRRKMIDYTALKETPYMLFTIGQTLAFVGLYVPFFYVQSYVIRTGIAKPDLAFYFLSIINAASTFGRIIPGYMADFVGPLNLIVPFTIIAGILCLALTGAHSVASVIVILVIFGFCSGTLVSLPPTIIVQLTANRAVIGTRIGMCFAIVSVGLLIGTPVSGAILGASSFTYVWVFGGIFTVAGGLAMGACRVAKGGWTLVRKC